MTEREMRQYLPIGAIADGCVLSKRGDITFGWRVWLPTAFSVSEAGYDSIIASFLHAYRLLPVYCIIHKQDVYRYDTFHTKGDDFFLAEAYERHFEGRKYLNGYSYIYLTFSTKANIESKNSDSGFFGLSGAKRVSQERIKECAGYASQFESILQGNDLLVLEPLGSEDFLSMGPDGRDRGVIAEYLGMYGDNGPDYNFRMMQDEIQYGDRIMKVWYVQDSDAYPSMVSSVKGVGSMTSGSSKVFLSGGSPIGFSLRIPHVVNRYILTLPKSTIEKELDTRRRLMNSFSLYSSECAVNSEELAKYLVQAAKDSTTTIKCFMTLEAWAPRNRIAETRNSIVTAFSELGVVPVEETLVAPLYHYGAIPGNAADIGYDNYVNSEITAFLCHGLWDGYDIGMEDGVIHVCDRRSMVPMKIDIQSKAREQGYINNMNALVIGPSGSGKSFTMNSLVQDFYTSGEHIMIIDVGDSYQGLCEVVKEYSDGQDGVYNTYDPDHPFAFNPFRGRAHWNEVDDEGDRTSSGYDFIISLLQTMYHPENGWDKTSSAILNFILEEFLRLWDSDSVTELSEILKEAFVNEKRNRAEKNHRRFDESKALLGWKNPVPEIFRPGRHGTDPVFDDFFQYVTRIVVPLVNDENYKMGDIIIRRSMFDPEAFGASMDMYKKGGTYGFLLNATEEADLFKSRLTVFEVDKIKDNKELFPLWVLCIMHSFEDKMRALPCQKVMVIEEAWKAIATETMANFIVWMWRTARKFRTSAVVVTQSINDLIGSDIVKDAIILNSDVKILLDQRKNANKFEDAAKILGLTPMAVNLVLSVNTDLLPGYKYKEGFFAIGEQYSNVFAIEVSLEQALTFETDKTLKKPLFERARQLGSFTEAVKEKAAEIRGKREW